MYIYLRVLEESDVPVQGSFKNGVERNNLHLNETTSNLHFR